MILKCGRKGKAASKVHIFSPSHEPRTYQGSSFRLHFQKLFFNEVSTQGRGLALLEMTLTLFWFVVPVRLESRDQRPGAHLIRVLYMRQRLVDALA